MQLWTLLQRLPEHSLSQERFIPHTGSFLDVTQCALRWLSLSILHQLRKSLFAEDAASNFNGKKEKRMVAVARINWTFFLTKFLLNSPLVSLGL